MTGERSVPADPSAPSDPADAVDPAPSSDVAASARTIVGLLLGADRTLAVAESLTGGLVVSTVVGVPGASAVLRGGVVAYATDLKSAVLGVDPALLAARSPVDPDVAEQMAVGVARLMGADYGLATTGVAGPDPQDGHPVGEVYVAVVGPGPDGPAWTRQLELDPALGRDGIRHAALAHALTLLIDHLTDGDV